MRKLSWLPLLFLLVFTSCKDDKETEPSVAELITGTWETKEQNFVYYDAEGQVLHQETNSAVVTFTFEDGQVTSDYGSGTYSLSEKDGKNFLYISQGNITQELEIVSISAATMTWEAEEENASYYDGGVKTADRAITSFAFIKK